MLGALAHRLFGEPGRKRGRTIFFSTHILNDVETLCDRVTILRAGEVVVSGALDELLNRNVRHTDVVLGG